MRIDSPSITGSLTLSGSAYFVGGTITASRISASAGITGSLFGTSSWASSASHARTASFVATSSWAISSSKAITASYIATSSWANNVLTANTASYVATSSWAISASYAPGGQWTATGSNLYFANSVGIGTVQPSAKLHVTGGTAMTSNWVRSVMLETTYPVIVFNSSQLRWAGIGYDYGNGYSFWVSSSTSDVSVNTAVAVLTNAGNLGLGVAAPTFKIEASGAIRAGHYTNAQTNTGEAWIGRESGQTLGSFDVQLGGSSATNTKFRIMARTGSTAIMSVNGDAPSSALVIDSTGNMGVNCIPSTRLHVSTNNLSDIIVRGDAATIQKFSISGSGTAYFAGDVVAFYSFSDERLKKDVRNIGGVEALNKVNSLQGVYYKWKEGFRGEKEEIGFIAQRVEEVVPEVVREQPRLENNETPSYKQVDYEHLVALLVEAVKEQQKQIEELKLLIK